MEKTPTMLLHEICAKTLLALRFFEIIEAEKSMQTKFGYKVTCNEHCAYGYALNKKEAKHTAATEMLKKLFVAQLIPSCYICNVKALISKETDAQSASITNATVPSDIDTAPKPPEPTANTASTSNSLTASPSSANYIGILQEFCISHKMSAPIYKDGEVTGPAHHRQFMVQCSVNSIIENGSGLTKKSAKQDAAKKLLHRIRQSDDVRLSLSLDRKSSQEIPANDKNDTMADVTMKISSMSLNKVQRFERDKKKILDLYAKLRVSTQKAFKPLIEESCNILEYHSRLELLCTYVFLQFKENINQVLQEVDHEQKLHLFKKLVELGFNATLETISLSTRAQQFFAVGMRLTTIPVIFSIGTGKTKEEAESNVLCSMLSLFTEFVKHPTIP